MSNSTSNNSPISNIITPTPTSLLSQQLESQNKSNGLLLHKLQIANKNHDILDKQLRQTKREYGELLLRNSDTVSELTESRREVAQLKAELNRLTSENNAELSREQVAELRLELKVLKHTSKEAEAELEELRKKAEVVAVLEAENLTVKKEKDEVIVENMRLKRANDSIIDVATHKFRVFEKRVVALESSVATIKLAGEAPAEAVSQEKMDPGIVYLDSD